MKLSVLSPHNFLSNIPIKDPVERRIAFLVQIILFAFLAAILIGTVLHLMIALDNLWRTTVFHSVIAVLIVAFPLALLRRGYFRSSLTLIIFFFFILESFAITTSGLRENAETLVFFTLTIILSGLLLGRGALVFMYLLSVSVMVVSTIRTHDAGVRLDSMVITGTFVFLNGIIAVFIDQFGLTFRLALTSALKHETELQHEVIERQRIEQDLQRRVTELEALYQTGIAFSQTLDQKQIAEKVLEVLRVHLDWHHAAVSVKREKTNELDLIAFSDSDHLHAGDAGIPSTGTQTGQSSVGWVIEHGQVLRIGHVGRDSRYKETYPGMHSGLYVPLKIFNRTLGCISVESDQPDAFTQEDEHLLIILAVQAAVAIENARLFQNAQEELSERTRAEQEIRRRELEYRSLAENIPDIVTRFDTQLRPIYSNDSLEKTAGISAQSFLGNANHDLPISEELLGLWQNSLNHVLESGKAQTIEFEYPSITGSRFFESRLVPEFDPTGKVEMVLSIARDITERKQAEAQIRQQLERLTALSKIDQAIMSSFDLGVTLDILLSQAISQLQVDAADVLLLSPERRTLAYAAGKGFRTRAIEAARVQMGESLVGRAAYEQQLIKIENLNDPPGDPLLASRLAGEDFVFYCGVPLMAKGEVIGMLEVFHRLPFEPYLEWLDFLNTLAGQAAIAIKDAALFENLQRSNLELIRAYDATIEGWSHAMDLRDKETEGHTQRVTSMTLELARAMQIKEAQLIHIRRGALLHDIGKLGIPDHILLKAEALSDDEWEIMRKHPQFAYEMLSSIRYLEPALNIPYCHHEKWDGTGYPRGLRGEQIPLEARIFAVVDVWDALRSDRPYRPAWDYEAARAYIREQAGTHFDPNIVECFLEIVK